MTAENDTATDTAATDTDALRLTAEELAFLLGDPQARADREERNARANRARTERRRSDPAYAERLRNEDRLRQRRHRAKAVIGKPEREPDPPVPLPALSAADALRLLETHLQGVATPQAAQLRRRPEALQRYAAAFELYRALSDRGERPTRGALAVAFAARFGLALTPSQIQKLRDQVEGFARPGGPWHAG